MPTNKTKQPENDPNVFEWLPEDNLTSPTTIVEQSLSLGVTVKGDLGGGTLFLDTLDKSGNWWSQPVSISKSPSYTHFPDLPSITYRLRLIGAEEPSPLITVTHNDPGKARRKAKAVAATTKTGRQQKRPVKQQH